MSYVATGGLSAAQSAALLDVEPQRLRTDLSLEQRLDIALRQEELRARESEAFWNAVQAFATAALPIAAFLGVTSIFRRSK